MEFFSSDSENNCLISYVIDPKNSNNNTIEIIKLKIIKYYIKLLYNFFPYIKMPRDSLVKYYQKIKKGFKTNFVKSIKIFIKKKKTRNDNMVVKDIKICLKAKNKELFEY